MNLNDIPLYPTIINHNHLSFSVQKDKNIINTSKKPEEAKTTPPLCAREQIHLHNVEAARALSWGDCPRYWCLWVFFFLSFWIQPFDEPDPIRADQHILHASIFTSRHPIPANGQLIVHEKIRIGICDFLLGKCCTYNEIFRFITSWRKFIS
jgi:hypothetical protein